MNFRIKKKLTPNDTGENGSHQAGLLIPRREEYLSFFPPLEPKKINPFIWIDLEDPSGKSWKFKFIYYNNKLSGKGTRNEYRITCMTRFFRERNIKAGDILIFEKKENQYSISYETSTLTIQLDTLWEVEFI